MSGPWDNYAQAQPAAQAGPWAKYGQTPGATSSDGVNRQALSDQYYRAKLGGRDDDANAMLQGLRARGWTPLPANPQQQDALFQQRIGQDAKRQSFGENLLIGAGHGFSSLGDAVQQAGAHVGNALGLVGNNTVRNIDQRISDDNRLYGAGVGGTSGGMLGDFGAQALATLPLGAAAIPAKGATLIPALARGFAAGAGVGMLQPATGGPDASFVGQKAQQGLIGGAFGAAVPAAGRALLSGAEAAFGGNAIAKLGNLSLRGANAKPFAQASEDLAQRTGIPFTPGQASGSKLQTGLENLARSSLFSADTAFQADTRVANAAVTHINKVMNGLHAGTASADAVGNQVQSTVRNMVQSIADKRASTAAAQYGAIDKALGGAPVVRYGKTVDALNAILGEFHDVPGAAAAGVRSQVQGMLDDIAKAPAYSIGSAQKFRSALGRAARGSADIFSDVRGTEQRRIASRLYGAITDDIETSANALDGGARFGPGMIEHNPNALMQRAGVGDAWRKANENYRNFSTLIDAVEKSPLRRLVGDQVNVGDFMTVNKLAPERVVSIMGNMTPSELGMVRNAMERNAPATWQEYKRLLVQNALDDAQTLPTTMGANTLPLSAAKFVRALGGDKPAKIAKLRAIFSNDEMSQIDDAFSAMRRLGDKFGANPSGTSIANQAFRVLRGGVRGTVGTAMELTGMHKIARVMLNANGRRALIEMSRLPPQTRQFASLAGYVSALANGTLGAPPDANVGADQNPQEASQ